MLKCGWYFFIITLKLYRRIWVEIYGQIACVRDSVKHFLGFKQLWSEQQSLHHENELEIWLTARNTQHNVFKILSTNKILSAMLLTGCVTIEGVTPFHGGERARNLPRARTRDTRTRSGFLARLPACPIGLPLTQKKLRDYSCGPHKSVEVTKIDFPSDYSIDMEHWRKNLSEKFWSTD